VYLPFPISYRFAYRPNCEIVVHVQRCIFRRSLSLLAHRIPGYGPEAQTRTERARDCLQVAPPSIHATWPAFQPPRAAHTPPHTPPHPWQTQHQARSCPHERTTVHPICLLSCACAHRRRSGFLEAYPSSLLTIARDSSGMMRCASDCPSC
jgi:hypothetical protein